MKQLYMKLLSIQEAIDNLHKNKQGMNYKYVDGSSVLSEVRPLMNANKIILKQEVLSFNNTRIDYRTSAGKEKSEILTSVQFRFTWVDCESGEVDENLFGANGMNDWDKGIGSAMTYAERYFLLKYFHIPTDADDPDVLGQRGGSATPPTTNQQPNNNTNQPEKWLNVLDKEKNFTKEWINIQKGISEKTITSVADVRKHYRVSKETEAKINELLNIK